MTLVIVGALAVFAWSASQRWQLLRVGRRDRIDRIGERISRRPPLRVRAEEDGLLPAGRARPQAHLRRLHGAARCARSCSGAAASTRRSTSGSSGPTRSSARPRLRVREGRRRDARASSARSSSSTTASSSPEARMTLSRRGHAHPRHHRHDDARRHGLRRRVASSLVAQVRRRCVPAGRRRAVRRACQTSIAHDRRAARRAPSAHDGWSLFPSPGGLALRRMLREARPGDPRRSSRTIGFWTHSTLVLDLPEPAPALEALPHHHGDPERLLARPRRRPAACRPWRRTPRSSWRDGEKAAEEADRRRRRVGIARIEHFILEGDPRLLHVHRVRPLLRQLPGAQDRQDALAPSSSRSICATTSTTREDELADARARRGGARARTAARTAPPRTARQHDASEARRSDAPRAARDRPARGTRRSTSCPTSSTPTCSGPAPPAAPARSSARC